MLTQLSSLKARLAIPEADSTHNQLLTALIAAASAHFESRCGRVFGRASNAADEFDASAMNVCLRRYPVESVQRFEVKTDEAEGWIEQTVTGWLVREGCVLSLAAPLGDAGQWARVTYAGGYVLPGTGAEPGQTALPGDLEQAVLEHTACWFTNRDKLGLHRNWPTNGTFQVFSQLPLLPWVREVLRGYARWEF